MYEAEIGRSGLDLHWDAEAIFRHAEIKCFDADHSQAPHSPWTAAKRFAAAQTISLRSVRDWPHFAAGAQSLWRGRGAGRHSSNFWRPAPRIVSMTRLLAGAASVVCGGSVKEKPRPETNRPEKQSGRTGGPWWQDRAVGWLLYALAFAAVFAGLCVMGFPILGLIRN